MCTKMSAFCHIVQTFQTGTKPKEGQQVSCFFYVFCKESISTVQNFERPHRQLMTQELTVVELNTMSHYIEAKNDIEQVKRDNNYLIYSTAYKLFHKLPTKLILFLK